MKTAASKTTFARMPRHLILFQELGKEDPLASHGVLRLEVETFYNLLQVVENAM